MKRILLLSLLLSFICIVAFSISQEKAVEEVETTYPILKGEIIIRMGYGDKIGQAVVDKEGGGPSSLAVDENGNIYMADGCSRIQVFNKNGKVIRVIKLEEHPCDISVNGGRIFISTSESKVIVLDTLGTFIDEVKVPVPPAYVFSILSDGIGNFYVNSYGYGKGSKWYKFDKNLKKTKETYEAYSIGISGENIYLKSKEFTKRTGVPSMMINGEIKKLKKFDENKKRNVSLQKGEPLGPFLGPSVNGNVYLAYAELVRLLNPSGIVSKIYKLEQNKYMYITGFANSSRSIVTEGCYIYAFASPAKGDTLLIVRYEFPEEEIEKLKEE